MAFAWNEENTAEVQAIYEKTLDELTEANEGTERADHSRAALTAASSAVGTSEASARIKLNKMDVYLKVTPKKTETKAKAEGGTKRVSKADAQAELVSAFKDAGVEDLDMSIVEKLTGKAAAHLAEKVRQATSDAE